MEHQPLRAPILRAGINELESKNTLESSFPPILTAPEDSFDIYQPTSTVFLNLVTTSPEVLPDSIRKDFEFT
jgi:hypothetical protein